MSVPAGAEARLLAGELAVIPTDTVYGIACAAVLPDACARLYSLKERPPEQPTALVFGSVEQLVMRSIPELAGPTAALLARVMPGPVTLVVANPARRFAHVCGVTPEVIGLRVPALLPEVADLADAVGGLLATSANLRGGPDPSTLGDVPAAIAGAAGFMVDGGTLRGAPSTVIDVTGSAPVVLRDAPDTDDLVRRLR